MKGEPVDKRSKGLAAQAAELYQGGIITLAIAPGLLVLGAALALFSSAKLFVLMAAVSTLLGLIGAGLLVSGYVVRRMG